MTEKFTKGAWEVQEFYYENGQRTVYEIVYNEEGDRVAEGVDNKADAHLMSQAKNMYECICDVLTDLQMPDGMRNHFEQVLKKARGEE